MILGNNPNDCYGSSPCLYRAKSTIGQPTQRQHSTKTVQSGIEAAGLLGVGILLHRIPPRLPEDGLKTILPSDWKVWAKLVPGISNTSPQDESKLLNWNRRHGWGAFGSNGFN